MRPNIQIPNFGWLAPFWPLISWKLQDAQQSWWNTYDRNFSEYFSGKKNTYKSDLQLMKLSFWALIPFWFILFSSHKPCLIYLKKKSMGRRISWKIKRKLKLDIKLKFNFWSPHILKIAKAEKIFCYTS